MNQEFDFTKLVQREPVQARKLSENPPPTLGLKKYSSANNALANSASEDIRPSEFNASSLNRHRPMNINKRQYNNQ